MQKKIIALAIAAAFSAPAFADVNMYGVIDAAAARIGADGQKSDLIAVSGGLSPSRVGVNASEDLSGGMKALVNLEYGLDTQTNSTVGATPGLAGATTMNARQQMLGLAGGFGTFATGYLQTTGFDFGMKFDPLGDSSVSPLQSMTAGTGTGFLIGTNAGATRAQRALAYISPNMSGFTVAVNYATALNGLGNLGVASNLADVKTSATLASVNYDWNALSVGGVYAKTSAPTGTASESEYALGGSYDLKVVKLFATYQSTKSDAAGASANKAMSFSALAPVGPGSVAFSYAKSTIASTVAANVATAQNSVNGSGYTVGYLQGLSKTTTAYVTLSKVTNGSLGRLYTVDNNAVANGALTAGGSSTMIAVGLNKKF